MSGNRTDFNSLLDSLPTGKNNAEPELFTLFLAGGGESRKRMTLGGEESEVILETQPGGRGRQLFEISKKRD